MKTTEALIKKLTDKIYTTDTLKNISDTLEHLASDESFKSHTQDITSDPTLTGNQKKTQLLYLLKTIDSPILYDFFSDILDANSQWIFSSGRINYFDKFVQEFQMATEDLSIVYLTTAIKLAPEDLKAITKDLTKSFGYKVVLNYQVNPGIIGGATVRVENLIFDHSLRTKFQQFQRHWISSLKKTGQLIGRYED